MTQTDSITKRINNYHRRLQKLQEQQSLFGINTAPEIIIEIEDIEIEIEKLQMELKANKTGTNKNNMWQKNNPSISFRDVQREILAGGGELHSDCEQRLLENSIKKWDGNNNLAI